MSHEIRTPLGAVLGYADLLTDPDSTNEDKALCTAAIARNGELLQKIIDDVLDLAKIEADRVEAELADIDLTALLEDLQAVHAFKAASKGIAFSVLAQGMLPAKFRSDSLRLKQILNNVISNAIKFTEAGSVELSVSFAATQDGGKIRFDVADTGIGLSPGEAGRLFQPFMQADSSTTRRFGGTGLGLVISKQLAHLLGGDLILADSKPGKGSRFSVYVDTGTVAPGGLVPWDAILAGLSRPRDPNRGLGVTLDGRRILVADDTADNRMLLTRILTKVGAVVDTAEDGREAVEMSKTRLFDAVLMDIQMPEMDGYEATRELRRLGFQGLIIALTAHAMSDERDRCLAAGANLHLTKPIDTGRLLVELGTLGAPA
jgi:CheY-like chemotaxis protein